MNTKASRDTQESGFPKQENQEVFERGHVELERGNIKLLSGFGDVEKRGKKRKLNDDVQDERKKKLLKQEAVSLSLKI